MMCVSFPLMADRAMTVSAGEWLQVRCSPTRAVSSLCCPQRRERSRLFQRIKPTQRDRACTRGPTKSPTSVVDQGQSNRAVIVRGVCQRRREGPPWGARVIWPLAGLSRRHVACPAGQHGILEERPQRQGRRRVDAATGLVAQEAGGRLDEQDWRRRLEAGQVVELGGVETVALQCGVHNDSCGCDQFGSRAFALAR
jgi:hypothetical protein